MHFSRFFNYNWYILFKLCTPGKNDKGELKKIKIVMA